jgi:sortase A
MSQTGVRTRLFAIAIPLMLVVGCWQVGSGLWIYAKARLAQLLLQRAWSQTLAGEPAVKPWPWADTWPVARLTVPSRQIDLIVLEGAYGRTLAFGPGHVESASSGVKEGTVILTGHRDTHFAFLEEVQPGERFVLQMSDGHIRSYRIRDRHVVDSRTGGIPLDREQTSLVLVTCYPFHTPMPGGQLRLVVTAEKEDSKMGRRESTRWN